MDRLRIRMLAVIVGLGVLTVASGAPALAQEGDESGRSLCAALTDHDLSEVLGARYRAEPAVQLCSWTLSSPYSISAGWQTGSLEDSKQFWTPGKDVTVGDRPGWLALDYGALLIQLDDGLIVLTVPVDDPEGAEATMLRLGEILVASAPSLIGPPTPEPVDAIPQSHADPDLEALFPTSVGDQSLTVQSMSGEVLLMGGEEALKPLTDALAAQGLTISDLVIGSASTATFDTSIQALRVKGGDAMPLAPILAQQVAQGATVSESEVAGRPVTVVATAGGDQYIYASGDVIWLVMATEPALSEIITALP